MRIFLLAGAALLWSAAGKAEDLSPAPAPVSETTVAIPVPSAHIRPMISQGDPAWRSVPLGTTTVGRAGCLALSLLDTLTAMGLVSLDPEAFIRALSESGLLTRNGLLRWGLDRLFPVKAERTSVTGAAAIEQAALELSRNARVLLEVRTSRGTSHWLAVSRIVGNDAEVRDPNGGRIGLLSSLYGVGAVRGLATIMLNH